MFEDIINLDDRAIQRVLKEVDGKDLALALKTANDELLRLVFKNMSTRAAASLKDDIEVLGPVRVREVGKAQQNIVDVIRTLEENGQIVIARGGKDDRIVDDAVRAGRGGSAVRMGRVVKGALFRTERYALDVRFRSSRTRRRRCCPT